MKGSLMGAGTDNGSAGSFRSLQDMGEESFFEICCNNFLILVVVLALCRMGNRKIMEKPFILAKRWGMGQDRCRWLL